MVQKRRHHHLAYFTSSFAIVLGLVLVWRGIWYVFDTIDKAYFGGSHLVTAVAGIIAGLLILYLPDKNLKELRKL